MLQHFRSWWRGEGGFIPATTGDSPTSTNADDNSNKSKLEHLPLVQETKGLSWYGSISLTPSVTSASSYSTSSSHDPNQVATELAVANPNKNQQNIKGQLPLSYIGSTMSSMEEARQPLLGMPVDDSHPIDPLQSNHHNHNTHDSTNGNTRSNNKKQGPPSLCWGAVANLCAATLGAGLLALPFAFAKAGWIGGLVLLTASAMATQYSITMIVMAAGAAKVAAVKTRAAGETISYRSDSYESLVEFLLGKPWRRLVEVCLVVFCFGCIIGYTITVGDLLEAAHLRNGDYRVASMVTVWCVAMFPLSLLRSMQSLQWASAVGIASIGTLVLATLVNLIEDVTSDPNHGSNHTHTNTTVMFATSMMWKLSKSGHGPKVDVAANFLQCLWPRDWTSFVRALPLILFAFSCQVNVCAIYDELPTQNESNDDNNLEAPATTAGEDPNERFEGNQTANRDRTVGFSNNNGIIDEATSHHFLSQKVQEQQVAMFRRVSAAAVAICASLYASIAIIGLANFGRHVFPNILSNYQVPINAMMQAAFAATALAVCVAFPLNIFPIRITLRGLLCTTRPDSSMNVNDSPAAQSDDCPPAFARYENLDEHLIQHHETPKLSLDHLENHPSVELAHTDAALQGGNMSCRIDESEKHELSLCAHFLLTFAIAGSALGIALVVPNISVVFGLLGGSTTSILGFVIPGYLGLAALDTKNDEGDGSESSTLSIHRWQCWGMVFGGAIIGVITTAVTIYSYTS